MDILSSFSEFENLFGLEKFENKLKKNRSYPLKSGKIDIFQMNVGTICNLSCVHCHVDAGPDRKEVMPEKIFKKCLDVINRSSSINTIDITGGSPEMNPHLEWFIREVSGLGKRVMVRTNLAILTLKEYIKFINIYAETKTEICASLPCYTRENVDRQRGSGVYDRCIKVLKELNGRGYGKAESGLILNLIYNPQDTSLPCEQSELENDYKRKLYEDHGIFFNNLFCIANMPIGRYFDFLIKSGNIREYMQDLEKKYNPQAVPHVMCKNTISVSWDGKLYDCDFNQILGLEINRENYGTIENCEINELQERSIIVHNHCYGCTAGFGSSCQGSLNEPSE